MSAAQEPAPNLAAIVEAGHTQHIKPAADRWIAALRQVRAAPKDPDHAIIAAILALEDMATAAKGIVATLRQELAASMVAHGVVGFETDHHKAVRVQAARRAMVNDSKALAVAHPDLMVARDPTVDLDELTRRLKAGDAIAGAALSNGGGDTLRISARKV